MIAKYVLPIDSLQGCIGRDYYARVLNGQKVIQRRPCRKGHVPSDLQLAARQSFKATCPGTKWRNLHVKSASPPAAGSPPPGNG